ncbi:acylneuraminate cytidylyltransferase [Bdellovibrio reynosensis]|uniref:Acylneuraminate cytidylyltransferase n=1 Tax=Bdellovibrio reynosensis TaxID=2835041 RepID=A0ABY4CBP3_9BACT|nr:acylneuraminate cytidylyltransferase [Bdellovibrio reynosensis]UOF01859.1 acylneuraminate cytidylyltransferase [Bdellovibrio reynosensis]
MKAIVIASLLALSFTTGFTCSKNQPAEQAPATTETAPAATEAAPAEGTPATTETAPAATTEAAPAAPAETK